MVYAFNRSNGLRPEGPMRVLRMAAFLAFLARPAAAGQALEQLVEEAGEEAVSKGVVPAAFQPHHGGVFRGRQLAQER